MKEIMVYSVDGNDKIHMLGVDTWDNLMKVNDKTMLYTSGYYRDFFSIEGQEHSLFSWKYVN